MFNEEFESKISSINSTSETKAFGRPVRRVYVGLNAPQDEEGLLRFLELTEHNEIIFLKFESSKFWVRRLLSQVDLDMVTSPETIYWKRLKGLNNSKGNSYELKPGQQILDGHDLNPLLIEKLVREVFAGYQNHYSSNIHLDRVSVEDAYVDWALNSLNTESRNRTKILLEDGQPIGYALIQGHESSIDVLLAGVTPKAEGTGAYTEFLGTLCNDSHLDAYISTQTSNIRVQKSWIRSGFQPYKSFSTVHLLTKD